MSFSQYVCCKNVVPKRKIVFGFTLVLIVLVFTPINILKNDEIKKLQLLQNEILDQQKIIRYLEEKNFKLTQENVKLRKKLEPSDKYEEARKRIIKSVNPFWENFHSVCNTLRNGNRLDKKIRLLKKTVKEYKIFLLSNFDVLSRNDGFDEWRKKEAKALKKMIQKRFEVLQNPSNCDNAKILKCYTQTYSQGFGSTLHQIAECFITAHFLNRTMIFNSTGFPYDKVNGFKNLFEPFSRTCANTPTNETESFILDNEHSRIVHFGTNIFRKAHRTSSRIPADIANRLFKLSDEPLAWWTGQVLDITIKYLPKYQHIINETIAAFKSKHPIVGVHIRRTDQLEFFPAQALEKYMRHVDEYFDQLELTQKIDQRRIYLATDEPSVILEMKNKYPHYEILSNYRASKVAKDLKSRSSLESLTGIIIDLYSLSKCDFVVCTFSSNICLLMQEIFQIKFPDTTNKLISLDTMYITDYRIEREAEAIYKYSNESKHKNFDLVPGDRIVLYRGLFKNGWYCGQNVRLKYRGFFPPYKVNVITDTFKGPLLDFNKNP